MVHNLFSGPAAFGNGQAIAYLVGGSLLGMVFGVIPGLGGAVVLSVILVGAAGFCGAYSLFGTRCVMPTLKRRVITRRGPPQ